MSLKPSNEVFDTNLIPRRPTFANFVYVFTQVDFVRYLLQHVLRFRSSDSRCAHLSLDGRLCARASALSRTRCDLSCDVRDLSDLAAGHHRAALHPRAHAPHARQLRGIDHSFDLQRLRHFPFAPILSRHSPRARGGGADRRRRLLPHLAVDHPAAEPADPVGARDPLLSRQLEFVPLAADDHLEPGPLDGAGRDRKLPSAVQRLLELRHGRFDRRGASDDRHVRHLPEAHHRVDQDERASSRSSRSGKKGSA